MSHNSSFQTLINFGQVLNSYIGTPYVVYARLTTNDYYYIPFVTLLQFKLSAV